MSLTPPSLRPKKPQPEVQHYAGCPVLEGKLDKCRCAEVRETIAHSVDTKQPVVEGLPPMTRTQRRAIESWQKSEARRQRRAERRKK